MPDQINAPSIFSQKKLEILTRVHARNFKNGVEWDPGTPLYINIEEKTKKNSRPS